MGIGSIDMCVSLEQSIPHGILGSSFSLCCLKVQWPLKCWGTLDPLCLFILKSPIISSCACIDIAAFNALCMVYICV